MEHRELWRADGRLVIQLRRERGWSRGRLAAAAGVSHHTVAKIERGEAVFPTTLDYVAAALDVTAAHLRTGGEADPAVAFTKQRLLDAARDRYGLYHAALRDGNFDLIRREFPKGPARNIRWTMTTTAQASTFAGSYVGSERVIGLLEQIFPASGEHRIEHLDLLSGRTILARGVERGTVAGFGTFTTAFVHMHEFDRRGRVIRMHQSVDVLSVEPS